MLTMKKFLNVENDVLAGEKQIFSLKDNWDLFRPHLEDADVVTSLRRCLGIRSSEEWDQDEDAPWTYTPSDYWVTKLDDQVQADIEYQSEKKSLFESMFGLEVNIEDDEFWDDFYESEAFSELDYRYYEKYQPKKYELDWYRWVHGCFFIAPFVATLLKTAIEDAEGILILTSETHSVASFTKNNVLYYADLLIEWDSVKDLEAFMGELTEVKFLANNNAFSEKVA
ncbi:hypothetical protein [Paenibacillus radicis (ex Xue et al. 2023)]|uniref:Uncharacterized protein n=1 Tax=Paenibacillus radicis (ex Xue et al. 2023) TaxID=2972489 RepID=A0ABT1YLN2_9BACL|nr:hypothetical protein [Paenibacillus radicis (ex Xue et al. 2023)]MCR8633927.1 hypothetical protein [Paenibacillus radicis (ex Xue et al. 2023)]